MSDLQLLYENLGFQDVSTYIQSGNVIFSTKSHNRSELKRTIEDVIKQKYKFQVPVELRTNKELANIINNCPFGLIDVEKEGTKVFVTFLSSTPVKGKFEKVQEYAADTEKLVLKANEIYLFCPYGYGKSKLSNVFLEQKLEVGATTRNWKTVNKLYELSM